MGFLSATNVGGATPGKYVAAAAANQDSQVIKASAGQLYGLQLSNVAVAIRYVKLYNKATAPTSADVPVMVIALPASSDWPLSLPMVGVAFSAGIAFRITTGIADNDTGAATAGDVVVNWQSA